MVGQKQTLVPVAPSSAMSSSVRWVACTTVVPGPSSAGVGEQLGRGDAVRREAGVVLGDLLGEVDVQRLPGRLDDDRQLLARHRADRVDRRPTGSSSPRTRSAHALRVAVGVAHAARPRAAAPNPLLR